MFGVIQFSFEHRESKLSDLIVGFVFKYQYFEYLLTIKSYSLMLIYYTHQNIFHLLAPKFSRS